MSDTPSNDQRPMLRNVFDGAADTYDAVGVSFFQPIADHLVSLLAPRPGERALDIGCGRGAVLFPVARAVGTGSAGGRVVGIDLSPRMIEATARDVAAAGLDIDVRVDDAQEPSLDAASFDLIAASLVLFFLPDPAAALVAWRELLVDGGRLGISTFGELSPTWHEVDAVFAPYLPPAMADPRTQAASSPFGSDAGMEALFTGAWFAEVRTASITVPVRFDDGEQWHRWTWSQGQRRMWEFVPESERAAVRAAASERLEATRDADGRIGFDQGVRYTFGTRSAIE